jgi:hypothetical protein
MYRVFVAPAGGICITPMISAFCLICGYNSKLCQAQSLGGLGGTSRLYNYLTIPQNLRITVVDSDNLNPLTFSGDAIATLTPAIQGGVA